VCDVGLASAVLASAIVESGAAIELAAKGELNVGKGQIVRVDTDCVLTDEIWGLYAANVVGGSEIGCVYVGSGLEESHFAVAHFNIRNFVKKVKVVLLACHQSCLGGEEKKYECVAEHGMF
jgi:hypothetical protein